MRHINVIKCVRWRVVNLCSLANGVLLMYSTGPLFGNSSLGQVLNSLNTQRVQYNFLLSNFLFHEGFKIR